MTSPFVERLIIKNIKQERAKKRIFNEIDIYFQINGINYRMNIYERSTGNFQPSSVRHTDIKLRGEKCPLCGDLLMPLVSCETLKEHLDDLFYRLINSKSLRLLWLYIPHEEANGELI